MQALHRISIVFWVKPLSRQDSLLDLNKAVVLAAGSWFTTCIVTRQLLDKIHQLNKGFEGYAMFYYGLCAYGRNIRTGGATSGWL